MRSTIVGKLVVVTAVAAALSACGKHKSGAGIPDDVGSHASMAMAPDGTVYAAFYYNTHQLGAKQHEHVGALQFAKGKVESDGYVHFGGFQTVDGDVRTNPPGHDVGVYTSIAIGSDGLPRIAYYDKTAGDLKLATMQSGNKWAIETVDSTGDVGGYASLVLENDQPRIAYYAFDAKQLKFAAKNGGSWALSVVDDGNGGQWDVGKWCSLAKDGNGGLGIAYYDATNGDLGYIVGSATGFPAAATATEWVDTDGDTGRWPKLAYDLGSPRIAYQDYTNQHLKFAKKDGQGAWAVEVVDAADWVGADTSIAIDPSGHVTVAYFDGLNNDARAAKWDGSTWTLSPVAQDGAVGYFNNVVLDPSNKPVYGWYSYTETSFVAQAVP